MIGQLCSKQSYAYYRQFGQSEFYTLFGDLSLVLSGNDPLAVLKVIVSVNITVCQHLCFRLCEAVANQFALYLKIFFKRSV